jgi:hypothetical protein
MPTVPKSVRVRVTGSHRVGGVALGRHRNRPGASERGDRSHEMRSLRRVVARYRSRGQVLVRWIDASSKGVGDINRPSSLVVIDPHAAVRAITKGQSRDAFRYRSQSERRPAVRLGSRGQPSGRPYR